MRTASMGRPAHEPIVTAWRGGMIESVHYGSAVLLDPAGRVVFSVGDIDAAIYPRSAAKPLQAVAMRRLGLELPDDLLALASSSHSGEPAHLAGVARILADGGLAEEALRNTPALPYGTAEREAWLIAGRPASRLAQNCSGKHAAMLRTASHQGWSLTDYLSPDHPLQCAIAATVEELADERIARAAVDGCGAPLFALSLHALARAIGRVAAAPEGTAERSVAGAIRNHPDLVAGSGRDVTTLMRAVPGLIAKDGAEGVQVASLPDGTSLAVKISDGGDRARLPITLAILEMAGVEPGLLEPLAAGLRRQDLAAIGIGQVRS